MVIDNKRTEYRLSYPTGGAHAGTAVCKIGFEGDYLPSDSCFFSGTAATAAGALAMSAAEEPLLRSNLQTLGYADIMTASFDRHNREKIGVCVGNRVKDGRMEFAVVLRGTDGDEWYTNFDIGYSAEHRGFAKAADYAEQTLGDYVFTRAIGMEPRFFVTGYSRGGAAANILAKRLCDRYGFNHVFAYTFASPNTTISRRVARYSSVFNLTRDEDFFTRVPLSGWGYTKYGRNIPLPAAGDVGARYRELTGEDYLGFGEQAPVDDFLCAVMTLAPNVHAYYERRREVGGRRLSLYEFMTGVADMLSEHMDEAAADVFMSAMVSDYADLMNFLSSGADLAQLLTSAGGVPRCSVADSHSPAAYMAALDAFLNG